MTLPVRQGEGNMDGMTEEEYCIARIDEIRRRAMAEAEPWVNRICTIKSMEVPRYTVFTDKDGLMAIFKAQL